MATDLASRMQDGNRARDTASEDVSGRRQMVWNVLTSWGTHLVFVVAGFVMPRLIDRHIGQTALGVWDLGWAVVNYFYLAQLEVGASVNRYVAKYRARNDDEGVRRVVSSVMCLQFFMALLVVLLTALVTWSLPSFFGSRLGTYADDARWVVALLGTSIAVHIAFDTFRGVITGCHRWDLHNGIQAGCYATTVVVMITTLSLGGGLRSLALANLVGTVATELARAVVAFRVYPELSIRLRDATWSQARSLLRFGGKSFLGALSRMILLQGNSLVVAKFLGPAALALYSRPAALVRHSEFFVNKFAWVLTPTASSLQGSGRHAEVRELVVESARVGALLALPVTLILTILGELILRVWMGVAYAQGAILVILALGDFLALSQRPVVAILAGLNQHGKVGLARLLASICGLLLGVLAVGILGWDLAGAALAVAVPTTLADGLVVAIYACRRLDIPARHYVGRAFLGPLSCVIPFALCLATSRFLFDDRPLMALAFGCIVGALVLGSIYWRYVVSSATRDTIVNLSGRALGRLSVLWT